MGVECRYVDSMDATQLRENTSSERALLRAVLAINRNKNSEDFDPAIDHIKRTRCSAAAVSRMW